MTKKESEILELKESTSQLKKAVISIASILTKHKKGTLIFGIKDNGNVIGQQIGKNTLRDISKTISDYIEPKIYPEIKIKNIDNKDCIVIKFEGENIPYFAYGRAYKRVSDEDKLLSKAELEKMILSNNKDKIKWDIQTNKKFRIEDISENKLKKYISDANLEYTNKKEVLKKLDLIKGDYLTNAAIILFAKNVEFKLLNLRCAVFSGIEKSSKIIDMTDFNGDLFELIKKSEQYILEHINVGMKLDGLKRINIPEINDNAFREAIINAFCHRDYFIPQEIQIAILKDRLEILNPGKLCAGLSIKDILNNPISERRNSLIADIFHKVDLVEKWGTGIGKIRRLEPKTKFEEISNFFMVTFLRKVSPQDTPQDTPQDKLTKLEHKILLLIEKDSKISRNELAKRLNITADTIKEYLERLKNKRVLIRIGKTSAGHWETLK